MTEKEFQDGFVNIYSRRLSMIQELLRCDMGSADKSKPITLSPDQLTEIIHHSIVMGWNIGTALETINNDAVQFVAITEFVKLYTKQISQVIPIPMEIKGL